MQAETTQALEQMLQDGEIPEELVTALARALGKRCFACHTPGTEVVSDVKEIGGEPRKVIYYRCPLDGRDWEQTESVPEPSDDAVLQA